MKAMILAAGLGTRLGELTESIPKPMLDINGRPLLAYNIENLVRFGFDEIIINLHYMPEVIKDFAKDGSKFNAKIEYSYEPELLGTAGGVRNAIDFFDDNDPFLVIYGDIWTNQNLHDIVDVHNRNNALATLVLHQRKGSNSLVKLEENNQITGFIERPSAEERTAYPFSWVNSGIQLLEKKILANLKKSEFADLPKNIYPSLVEAGKLFGLPLSGNRIAIDSADRYNTACKLVKRWNT